VTKPESLTQNSGFAECATSRQRPRVLEEALGLFIDGGILPIRTHFLLRITLQVVARAAAKGSVIVDGDTGVARAVLQAATQLDEERRTLYTDLALFALAPAVRAALELQMDLSNYEFKSPLFHGKNRSDRPTLEGQVFRQFVSPVWAT
jgi:hypothetical protein